MKDDKPPELFRFVLWFFSPRSFRADALADFDADFVETVENFGKVHGILWACGQAVKSIPISWLYTFIRLMDLFFRMSK